MFKTLVKLGLYSLGSWVTGGSRRNKKPAKAKTAGQLVLYALLMVYVVGVFGFLFYTTFDAFCTPLHMVGLDWLYFIYVFISAFALMFIFSIFMAKSKLYEAKDNDLLLSLPISPASILASRMVTLLLMNIGFGLVVMIPAGIVWFAAVEFSAMQLVAYVLICLMLPFFALALSSLFGWLLSLAASKMRRKTLFETIVSVVFLVAYFWFFMQMNQFISSMLANTDSIAAAMSGIAPLYWLGNSIGEGNALQLLFSALILLLPFAAVYVVLAKTFIKTATAKRGMAKIKYEDKGQKVSSASAALFNREMRRFLSNSTYILNAGLGAIMLLAGGIALFIFRSDVTDTVAMLMSISPELEQYVVPAFILAAGLVAGISPPSNAAVSLEGHSIWIIQSLPVTPREALMAKLKVSVALYLPPLVLCIISIITVFSPPFATALISSLLSVSLLVFNVTAGLFANLRHPNLEWQSEAQAVKSGMAVFVSMMLDLGLVSVIGVGGYFLIDAGLPAAQIMLIFLAVLVAIDWIIYEWIMGKGARIFSSL